MYNCEADLPIIPCEDKKHECKNLANKGWCYRDPGYMRPNCRKSCGLCDSFRPPTKPPTRPPPTPPTRPPPTRPPTATGRSFLFLKLMNNCSMFFSTNKC